MDIISSRLHGMLDFIVGICLVILPWFMQGSFEPEAVWTPAILGCATLVYSAFTNYELGRFKVLSMRMHLVFDFIAGLALAISPWLFQFNDEIYLPYVIVGAFEILVVLLSEKTAYHSKNIEAGNKASFPAHSQ